MAMPRSESRPLPEPARAGAWLADAGEVAQWTAQLLAWLWLGQQGQRLGWSLASGVLAVALWWAMRVLCRGTGWAFRCPSSWVVGLGLLTALGVGLSGHFSALSWGQGPLLALAAVWGCWSALVETRSQTSSFVPGRWPWQPVLAAALLGLAWLGLSGLQVTVWVAPAAGLALALCAAVLFARDRQPAWRARACSGAGNAPHSLLAPSAMGLMMGTLWLGHDWCMGPGWTTGQTVAAHVALMAGLPALTAWALRRWQAVSPAALGTSAAPELAGGVLIALGALMWLGNSPAHGLLAMLLPSLAWALHCQRPRPVAMPLRGWSAELRRCLALMLGPVLLVAVGLLSPVQGPLAIQWALACLGLLAGVTVLAWVLARCGSAGRLQGRWVRRVTWLDAAHRHG